MRILHISPSFYPATYWGGPILSTLGLCNSLANRKQVELRVLTTDAAGPKLSQRLIVSGFPERIGVGFDVFYCRRNAGKDLSVQMLRELGSQISWADVVHLTGTYSFPTLPTLWIAYHKRKPVVWSPRGTLQAAREWREVRRKTIKQLFEKLCNTLIYPGRVVLHLTSTEERRVSETAIPAAACVVIPNGVDIPEIVPDREWVPNGRLRILFISRLDPKKGLEILIDAIQLLMDSTITVEICGTGDPQYVAQLKVLVKKRRLCAQIHFLGHVSGEDKVHAFARADVCVLPSYSENFGMVIAESLANGVPVVTSKMTPWKGVEINNCGLWVENSSEKIANAITQIRSRDLAAMGARGREWMRREFAWPIIAEKMMSVYEQLLIK